MASTFVNTPDLAVSWITFTAWSLFHTGLFSVAIIHLLKQAYCDHLENENISVFGQYQEVGERQRKHITLFHIKLSMFPLVQTLSLSRDSTPKKPYVQAPSSSGSELGVQVGS